MKILSKSFIKNFKGKILNIHPSLLPKYKGLNTHERAIKNKDKYSGCTVHFVNSKLDSGKIINQKKVRIKKLDTPKTLAKRILIQEHKLYPAAIIKCLVFKKEIYFNFCVFNTIRSMYRIFINRNSIFFSDSSFFCIIWVGSTH